MALESIRGGYRGPAQCTQAGSQIAMGLTISSQDGAREIVIPDCRDQTSHSLSGLREPLEAELAMT